ncbi:CPBP family intramembrane metalloprotease [Microbacteriaceae bacterium VKM Ac-2855]|nr:CPBP family intramembrane metalloprotease [Microbacteriaceae bacterium VKM Ac-2855]
MSSAGFPPPDPATLVEHPPTPWAPPVGAAAEPEPYSSALYLPPPEVRWGLPLAALSLLGIAAPLSLLIVLVLFGLIPYSEPIAFAGAFGSYLVALIVPVVASRWRGLGSLRDDFGLSIRWIDVPIGIGLGLGIRIALIVVLAALSPLLQDAQGNLELAIDPLWFVLSSVFIPVVVAPIVEEVLCRGLIMRAVRHRVLRGGMHGGAFPTLARRTAAIVVSIVASTLVFAALHGHQMVNLSTVVVLGTTTVLAGLVHGWIATKTGRLGAAMVSHATMNGSAVGLLVLVQASGLAG